MRALKFLFLSPCLPYYFLLFMWVTTRILESNTNNIFSLFDLSSKNLTTDDKLNYQRATSMIRPFEYAYSLLFWVYFLKYILN